MWDWVCCVLLSCPHPGLNFKPEKPTFPTNHSSRDTELKNNIMLKDPLELLSGQTNTCNLHNGVLLCIRPSEKYVFCKQPASPSSAAVISCADGNHQKQSLPAVCYRHSCTGQLLLWHLKANVLQEVSVWPPGSCFWQTTDISSVLGGDSVVDNVAKAIWWVL